MIEVLITIFIMAVGLAGLVQLQDRLQKSEVESYQRSQALILVNDMASRLTTNRVIIENYETTELVPPYLGVGGPDTPCDSTYAAGIQLGDSGEWCQALRGAAETFGGSSAGAMVGGRGCVEDMGDDEFMVTVVWQGLTPISAPPVEVDCGANLYNLPAGSDCANPDYADRCRRYVSTIVRVPILDPP